MNNNLLLSVLVSTIPILAIGFVSVLVLYKLYVKIRSKFNITVNCWFCNQNAKVPYAESNSWTCPNCEQYNGFTKDGDYNREMFQQLDCSNASTDLADSASDLFGRGPPRNGFCNVCNEAQRLKIEKLAQFEPKHEACFDAELKVYKSQLEDQYRLCSTCDRHLNQVLREKKKMVLGSKFLDFIIKGAETLKQPHFTHLRHIKKLQWQRRLTLCTCVLSAINICCLLWSLPTITRDNMTQLLGTHVGGYCFFALSHVLAFVRVIMSYLQALGEHEFVVKICLFARTICMMLLYSLGLKLPQIVRFNFSSLYMLVSPFVMLLLSFAQNTLDGFRLSRHTALLVLWSITAGGLVAAQVPYAESILQFGASLLALICAATSRIEPSPKLHDTTANSFHKIYSEDYLSDEDTVSLLSQQLNSSNTSVKSANTSSYRRRNVSSPLQERHPPKSPRSPFQLHKSQLTSSPFSLNQMLLQHASKSPLTASSYSLNKMPLQHNNTMNGNDSKCSPNFNANVSFNAHNDAASMHDFRMSSRPSLYNANVGWNARARAQSSVFGASGNSAFANSPMFHLPRAPFGCENERYMFPGANRAHASTPLPPAASVYACSTASNSLYAPQKVSNLLTPSRFSSTNNLATSWLSGGYFNQQPHPQPQSATASPLNTRLNQSLYEHRHAAPMMTAHDENASRASSQSSGFESQNGRGMNFSRENSYGPLDATTKTLMHEDNAKGFQPIEPRASLLTQPLSVNCSFSSADAWSMSTPTLRKSLHPRDSFNLRKINEELPAIPNGDLLSEWHANPCAT